LKKKILLVDDEETLVTLVRVTLEEENYDIIEANDGDTAVRLAREQHPDLVLLDVRIPGKNGFEVCRIIKSEIDAAIPVLLLTAGTQKKDREAGAAAGADDFVTKPFSPLTLLDRVKTILKEQANGR